MINWAKYLINWYLVNKRDMPWRDDPSPYKVWISEMMLQQTQVNTVRPYFDRFIGRFPDVVTLAQSSQQDVLKFWEGLGYYSRARNLHRAAQIIHDQYNDRMPNNSESLQQLPGIGPYASAAIASIAFGEPVPCIDGNVIRVTTRLLALQSDSKSPAVHKQILEYLNPLIKNHNPSNFNQAMMELGALICKPKNPLCNECPVQQACKAFKGKLTDIIPVKKKASAIPHYTIGVGIILNDRQVYIQKRPVDKMLGGLWEFPGGKKEQGENIDNTVIREIKEETGFTVSLGKKLGVFKQTYSHFSVAIHSYLCSIEGSGIPVTSTEYQWVDVHFLDTFPFPKVNLKIISALIADMSSAINE